LKGKLGCFKYEGADNKDGIPGGDNEIVEAVFLAPKSYVKRTAKGKICVAGKGVPTSVLQEQFGTSVEHYKEAVFTSKTSMAKFRQFRSSNHIVMHCEVEKVALSADNDKVFQVSPHKSRPLGHWRNREPEEPCSLWDLEDSGDEAVPLAEQMIADNTAPFVVAEDDSDSMSLDLDEWSDVEDADE
jgi:hypothetical protein